MTGPIDVVTDGARFLRVANGHPMMATVTGTGCMATSVVAACAAVEKDAVIATAAALAAYGLAGEFAAVKAQGPGTFQVHLFDALAGLTEDALRAWNAHRRVRPRNFDRRDSSTGDGELGRRSRVGGLLHDGSQVRPVSV